MILGLQTKGSPHLFNFVTKEVILLMPFSLGMLNEEAPFFLEQRGVH